MNGHPRHDISVLMPAYNAESYVLESVQSVLAQTYENFELLVIDDHSTDRTLEIVSGISDRRLRIIQSPVNMGVVGALNRGMSVATGRYIARIDADDLCLPTRFAQQREYLEKSPQTMILGTDMSVLDGGMIRFNRPATNPDPKITHWMLLVGNPIGHPSMMFRADVVARLGAYLREEFRYAEDFDFSHRALTLGDVTVLQQHLVIYRRHDKNLTVTGRTKMIAKVSQILASVYSTLMGANFDVEAALVSEHLIAGNPVTDPAVIPRLGEFLNELIARFAEMHGLDSMQHEKVVRHTGRLWWQLILRSFQPGQLRSGLLHRGNYDWSTQTRPSMPKIAYAIISGLAKSLPVPRREPSVKSFASPERPITINGVGFQNTPFCDDGPPKIYIVVDTEAEFHWSEKFDSAATSVKAMSRQTLAQSIFDGHGARPIYVVDYAVASQPEGYEPLRDIFRRRACVIGAHLHPWVNPPFEEVISDRNSFAGNLPVDLEERKLRALVSMIHTNFGVSPMFYKAGRYGLGPGTMETLRRLNFEVDFSILPMADLTTRGGPDFRSANSLPYRTKDGKILSLPMTRGQTGLLTPMPQWMQRATQSSLGRTMRLPGILSRTRLANIVTLTPEGVSAQEQIDLIKSMYARRCRTFVMHYHSTSLGKYTPYVKNDADLKNFINNIETVCRFFFKTMGGMPGSPADLVPQSIRDLVWTDESHSSAAHGHAGRNALLNSSFAPIAIG